MKPQALASLRYRGRPLLAVVLASVVCWALIIALAWWIL